MLAFIESIITLLIKLLFVERLAQENEELKKKNQRLKQENQELAKAKAEVIENHFRLFQKYLALNQRNEELIKQLLRFSSGKGFTKSERGSIPNPHPKVTTRNPQPSNFDIIAQLLQEFYLPEALTERNSKTSSPYPIGV